MDEKIKTWIKELEERKQAIGAERDKLRELINTVEELESTCISAYDDIDAAIDSLSNLV